MNLFPPAARSAFNQAQDRFLALQPRERVLVAAGAALLLLTVLYLALWEPLVKAHAARVAALESSRALAVRLEEAAQQLAASQRRGAPGANAGRSLSLMAAVDQASREGSLGKAPERIQPEGDREVRVWFEDLSFDALVRWIAELDTRYGVTVQTLDVEPQPAPGRVNVRLSLVRPS